MDEKISILRRKQVERRTGLKRSTMYLMIAEGEFPKPIKLRKRSAGWVEHEIEDWIVKRIKKREGKLESKYR
jgi:prophage regulatory protein